MHSTNPAICGENVDIISFASVAILGLHEMVHNSGGGSNMKWGVERHAKRAAKILINYLIIYEGCGSHALN